MALVKCPECGLEISDKAIECIHCGKILVTEENKQEELKCVECGTVLNAEDKICKNCGCPIEIKNDMNDKPQQVEVASIKMAQKTKKKIIIGVIVLAICVAVGLIIKSSSEANSYNAYIESLEKAQVLMLDGGSDAESQCNLALRVWQNAIYEERDDETDRYTRPDGYFVDDFNEALMNLYSDAATVVTINSIESNQAMVKDVMKQLQNPPEELENCYDTVSDLYEAYKKLTDLAVDPTGSFNSYAESKRDAVSDFMSAFDKLDSQIPEKE